MIVAKYPAAATRPRDCLECVQKGDPSRRDGTIGSDRRATIGTIN
jgi:hypothetical protein